LGIQKRNGLKLNPLNNLKYRYQNSFLSHFFYPWGFLLTFWLVAVASRYLFNGMVYGLDFGIYQPDGVWYSLRTLQWLGNSGTDAASQIVNWYSTNSAKGIIFTPEDIFPVPDEVWGLVAPRILYSLLSIPFVLVFGMKGMLVIPALSLLVLMIVATLIGKMSGNLHLGVGLAMLFSTSPTILRWTISNTTDSLLLGLFSVVAYCLYNLGKHARFVWILLLLVVLTNFTRFAFPVWVAIGLVLFLNKFRKHASLVLIVNLITSMPIFFYKPEGAFLPLQQNDDLFNRIISFPKSLVKVGFFEIAQIAVLDRLFLFFLIIALIGALSRIKHIDSMYFILVLLAVWAIGAINGNIGVNFRYQMPLIPFGCLPFIAGLVHLRERYARSALNIIRKKT
jgi:hypothetical protein